MIEFLLQHIPPCLFHKFTGLYCPGCGGTRSFFALICGHVLTSLYYHPLVVYIALCLIWGLFRTVLHKLSRGELSVFIPKTDLLLQIAVIIVIVNCFLRNALYLVWGITL